MTLSRRQLLGLVAGLPLGVGCVRRTPPPAFEVAPDRRSARRTLESLSDDYEALMKRHAEARYRASGRLAAEDLAVLETQELELLSRAERLLEYHEALLPPPLTRSWQLGVLGLRLMRDAETLALERDLEQAQNSTVEVAGKAFLHPQLEASLRSRSPEERDAAAAGLEVLQRRCAPIARQLLLRRRARARELGEDYYEAALRVRRVSIPRLEELARAFVRGSDSEARITAGALRRVMRTGAGRKRGHHAVHDAEFALERVAMLHDAWFPRGRGGELVAGVAEELGLAENAAALLAAETISGVHCPEEPASLPVVIPDDVRPLLTPARGLDHWRGLLRELGRVVQLTHLAESEPILKGYPFVPGFADPAFDQGFAQIFTTLLGYPELLGRLGRVPPRLCSRAVASQRTRQLLELRRSVAWMTFERRAHANPGQDLDRLAARAFARLTGLNQPVSWATDVRLIGCVGAEPAAFLAKLFAYDVHDWLRGPGDSDAAPGLSAQSARQLLGSLLASGVSRSLDEKLLAARGSRLSARPALLQLTRHRRRPSLVLTL